MSQRICQENKQSKGFLTTAEDSILIMLLAACDLANKIVFSNISHICSRIEHNLKKTSRNY